MPRLLLLPLLCLPALLPAQISFTPILETVPAFSSERYDIRSDAHGHYYVVGNESSYFRYLVHSADGGLSWSVTGDPEQSRRYFIGQDGWVYALESQLLLRSADHGSSFEPFASDLPATNISDLEIDMDGNLYLVGNTGIHRSTDEGANWTQVSPAPATLEMLPGRPDLWVWWTSDATFQLWHSHDQGASWNQVYSTSVAYYNNLSTALTLASDGMLYLSVGGDYNRVLRSADGAVWEEYVIKPWAPAQIKALGALPDGTLLCYMNDQKWYRSTSQGVSWQEYEPDWRNWYTYLRSLPDGKVFAEGGMPMSVWDPGSATWRVSSFALEAPYELVFPDEETALMLISGGLLFYRNGEFGFHSFLEYQNSPVCVTGIIEADDSGGLYISNCLQAMFSPDGGLTFAPVFSGSSVVDVVWDDGALYVLTHENLYVSQDMGQNWTQSAPVSVFHSFNHVTVSPEGRVYVTDYNRLWRSDNGGATLQQIAYVDINCCFYDLFTAGDETLYAMHDKEMWVSEDFGVTWNVLGTNPLGGPANSEQSVSRFWVGANEEVFAAGQEDGQGMVYHSTDHGQTWQSYQIGPKANTSVRVGRDGHLYLVNSGSIVDRVIVYKSDQQVAPATPVGWQEPLAELSFRLYPNPAADQVVLELPEDVTLPVDLRIVDIHGRTVLMQNMPSMLNSISMENLPAGFYMAMVHDIQGRITGRKAMVRR